MDGIRLRGSVGLASALVPTRLVRPHIGAKLMRLLGLNRLNLLASNSGTMEAIDRINADGGTTIAFRLTTALGAKAFQRRSGS